MRCQSRLQFLLLLHSINGGKIRCSASGVGQSCTHVYTARTRKYGELHDLDYEKYPDEHCKNAEEIMRERGLTKSISVR